MNIQTTNLVPVFERSTFAFGEAANDRLVKREQNIALIGPCPDRACGIATFTNDILEHSVACDSGHRFERICILRGVESSKARISIIEQDAASYRLAAQALNEGRYGAVWIQHEYGIFGGEDGEFILELAERIAAPLLVTFHTVLKQPSENQRAVIQRLTNMASRIMVMSRHGRDMLIGAYGASADRINIIEHGAPDRPLNLDAGDGPLTLSTFGLLGPGKGLETALIALSKVKKKFTDFRYRIIGATHPNLIAREGEIYRSNLQNMVLELGLSEQVEWVDKFLDIDQLLTELDKCEIYLTPYPNLQQSTSGTLSFAVALGKAVISTPYIHATELLGDDNGRLFPPGDSDALAAAILELALDRGVLNALRERAWQRGRRMIWPEFVAEVDAMIDATILAPLPVPSQKLLRAAPGMLGFRAMVDGTGMLQHGHGSVPNRAHGYCVDDNVRALMLTNAIGTRSDPSLYQYMLTFCAFIQHSYNPDTGYFRNFMGYDRQWLEDTGSEDSNGRTLWSLGHTVKYNIHQDIRWWALDWFDRTVGLADRIDSPRACAFAALGAANVLDAYPEHEKAKALVERVGEMLFQLLKVSSRPDWTWFETVLAYDNPRLAEGLIRAGRLCGRRDWLDAGIDALRWINRQQTSEKKMFRPIGSEGFGKQHDFLPFDQQPLEAWSAIDACAAAHEERPDDAWLAHAELAMSWFHGNNDRHQPLVDIATGACRDGITPLGINQNRGAESILAFQLGYQGYMQMLARTGRGNHIHDERQNGATKPVGYSRTETNSRPASGGASPLSSQLAG